MAWTSPRVWTAGDEVTADLMNRQIRDNFEIVPQTSHGDSFGCGAHSDYVECHEVVAGPKVPPVALGIAATVALGAVAATELKKPVTRRGLFTLGWFRGEEE